VAWASQYIVTAKPMRKANATAPSPASKEARQKSLNPKGLNSMQCCAGRKKTPPPQRGDRPFFWQPLGLIFLWPAQAGYGDKWPSE
jgi:hypothetical protein